MAISSGRLGWLGIALNETAGDDDAPEKYIPFRTCTLKSVMEPIEDNAARGLREAVSAGSSTSDEGGPIIGKTSGVGTTECFVDVENAPYLLIPALGSVSTTTASGEDAVYEHTITRKATNAPKTATLVSYRVVDTEKYLYAVANSTTLAVSDGEITISTDWISKLPTAGEGTKSLTEERILSFKDYTVKFGDTLTAADEASATPLTGFNLTINNNAEPHYLSGSSDVNVVSLGNFELSGDFSLFFEAETQKDIYETLDKKAMVISITGASIGNSETAEIQIRIPRVYFTDHSVETGIDGFYAETPSWKAGYDSGQSSSISVIVTNETASYT